MPKAMNALVALAFLGGATSPAGAEWWEATTDHFIVYSESNRTDAEAFTANLDRFDGALRTLQNFPVEGDVGRANKVTVFRTGETSEIGQLAGSPSVAGFYIPQLGRPVAFVPVREDRQRGSRHYESNVEGLSSEEVLKHEYTHHFMLRFFPTTYPDWFVEGFAELMATVKLYDDGTFHVGDVPNYRGEALRALNLIPMERFLDNKRKRGFNDFRLHYAQGWLVSHYLSFNPKRSGQLDAYLKAITKGEASLIAAQRIFGDLAVLDKELTKYVSVKARPGINVKPGNYTAPRVSIRRLSEEEVRLMRIRIKLYRGVTRAEARNILSELRTFGSWTNDNLGAQLLIAEAALDSRKYGEASTAADRALALDPKSVQAMVFKARTLSEAGDRDGMGDKSRFGKARSLFAKARQLDASDPIPLLGYYDTFENANEPITEQGRLALDAAYPMASFNPDYRITLGRVLLDEGRMSEARNVLMPGAFSAHRGDPEKNPMTKVAQAIEADDLAGARTAMAELFTKRREQEAKEKD